MSRPLPWVVRVHFQFENSMKGILCSGEPKKFKLNGVKFFSATNIFSATKIFSPTKIFSATIIDRYWLVTSKKCCLNKESFQVIFNDENKSQWLFWRKRRNRKCVRQTACSKMIPRADQEFSKKLLM